MRAIARRLRRLEDQFGPADLKPQRCLRLVVRSMGRTPSLERATCKRTLCADGTIMELVHLDGPLDCSADPGNGRRIERGKEPGPGRTQIARKVSFHNLVRN